MINKLTIKTDGSFVCLFWGEEAWKKVSKKLGIKGLASLCRAPSQEEAGRLFAVWEKQAAKHLAVTWLGKRGLFCRQIQEKLRVLGVSDSAIEEVLVFCQEIGALDDQKLVHQMKEKEIRRGYGVKKAEMKARRFIDVEEGQKGEFTALEQEAILRVLQKKKIDPSLLDWGQRGKLVFSLLQRGFAKENIDEVLSGQA